MNIFYKHRELFFILATIAIFFCASVYYLNAMEKVDEIYTENAKNVIFDIKQGFLQDTVNQQIQYIDNLRRSVHEQNVAFTNSFMEYFARFYKEDTDVVVQKCESFFTEWNDFVGVVAVVARVSDQKVIFAKNYPSAVSRLTIYDLPELNSWKMTLFGEYQLFININEEMENEYVKEQAKTNMRLATFSDSSYVSASEVLDYNGGDDYAIVLVDPNMPEREGQLLSTDIKDINGEYHFLQELEGINSSGEVFYTYHTKKINSDDISEKLTYAKLYKDYDWIICMGVYLDDMHTLASSNRETNQQKIKELFTGTIILIIVMLGVVVLAFALTEKWHYRLMKKDFVEKLHHDTLTNAFNRRAGGEDLTMMLSRFHKNRIPCSIMMLDIDHFKKVNDTYGHDIGDRVLIDVVNALQSSVRSTDYVYRWGGEEFVLVCSGIGINEAENVAEKILRTVECMPVPYVKSPDFHVTISIGLTTFLEKDTNYSQAIKRADTALYKSKNDGRNRLTVWNESI